MGRRPRTILVYGARYLQKGRIPRTIAITVGLLIVGLLQYAYLPLAASADPPLNWGDPHTPIAIWRHLIRADYGTFSLVVSDPSVAGSAVEHLGLLFRNIYDGFTPVGCLLVLAGAWWLWRHERSVGLALLLAFLLSGPAFVAYARPPIDNQIVLGVIERFYILPSIFAAVALGLGVTQLAERLGRFATASIEIGRAHV